MSPFRRTLSPIATIAAACLILFTIVACSGCTAKKDQTAKKAEPETKQVNARVAAVKQAKSLKVAFDNPKMGECPVCGSPVNYESFVSVGHKRYALCSDECVDKLQNDPKRYLAAASFPGK